MKTYTLHFHNTNQTIALTGKSLEEIAVAAIKLEALNGYVSAIIEN